MLAGNIGSKEQLQHDQYEDIWKNIKHCKKWTKNNYTDYENEFTK